MLAYPWADMLKCPPIYSCPATAWAQIDLIRDICIAAHCGGTRRQMLTPHVSIIPEGVTGEIIMAISTHDWAWSRLKLIKGFPIIKTHDWGRLGDLIWIYIDLCGCTLIHIDL